MKLLLFCLVVATLQLTGCQVAYTSDGEKRGFTAGFTPTVEDYKAIRSFRR